jgi:hypothetical protein
MRATTRGFVAVGVTLAASGGVCWAFGCSSSGGSGTADPFVGHWSCDRTSTTMFSAPPNTPTATAMSTATVVETDDGKGNITSVNTPIDAGPPCTLKSTLDSGGKSRTLTPGQTCMTANGDTLTYTSGGATFNADGTYSSMSAWTLAGTTAMGNTLTGTGTGSGTCTKM